jgi:galactokinase
MALLCQKVENRIAGAPCGVMDQMTSVCGESHALMALLCQPAELRQPVRVPGDVEFWGLDSGERHAVRGSDYTAVRTAAFMGYRIISSNCGNDYGGYLANVSPVEFAREFVSLLPDQISGADFLARYSGTIDTVTSVDPVRIYNIRQAAAHPVFENYRVHEFRRLLPALADEAQRVQLGEWMYQSHESYSACGLGSRGTDLIVDLVRKAGAGKGLYGARITGGGSGGTVAILGRADAHRTIEGIVENYRIRTGYAPHVFSGSSPGAAQFGSRMVAL